MSQKQTTHLSDAVGDAISRGLLLNTWEISPTRTRRKNISSKIHLRGRIMIMAVWCALTVPVVRIVLLAWLQISFDKQCHSVHKYSRTKLKGKDKNWKFHQQSLLNNHVNRGENSTLPTFLTGEASVVFMYNKPVRGLTFESRVRAVNPGEE